MKSRYFILICIFAFIVVSCHQESNSNRFVIQATFSSSKGENISLCELDVEKVIALDSSKIGNDGQISFSHHLDQPGFYLLKFPDGRRLILVIKNGETILIKGNLKKPTSDLSISGSEESQFLQAFFSETAKNTGRIDSIKKLLLQHEGLDDFLKVSMTADSLFFRISGDQKKLEKAFIDKNPRSLSSLIVLNYSFGPKPVLSLEEDLPYYQKLMGLFTIYPKNKHVLYHMARLNLYMNNLKNPVH
jgi:hypothetical protein